MRERRVEWELDVSTHSRPKAAGVAKGWLQKMREVSTHSRPKAAGLAKPMASQRQYRFNTQPPEGGWSP